MTHKEFKADFESPTLVLDNGLSLNRRPDSLSLDYLTSYTLGPVQLGDFSLGAVERVWKVRASGSQVFVARQTDDRSSFEPEVLLFSFSADSPVEIDAAFDQAAHILVCMESPSGPGGQGELLVYYFDPFVASYIVANFGTGRTPRAVLDDPVSSSGDILVFYINDSKGICYRQQRDRYLTEYILPDSVPVPDVGDGTLYGPVVMGWSGPIFHTGNINDYDLTGISGYTELIGTANGILIHNSCVGLVGDGVHSVPISGTWFAAQPVDIFLTINNPVGFTLTFDSPITGLEIEAVGAVIDHIADVGGSISAYDSSFHLLGTTVIPPHTTSEPNPIRAIWIRSGGIKYVNFLGSYWGKTSWRNLRIRTDPPPYIAPADPLLSTLPNVFLEDVYKSTDNRVHILFSIREPLLGTYSLGVKATVLYPFSLPSESWMMNPALPNSGTLSDIIITHGLYDKDSFQQFPTLVISGELLELIIHHTLYDVDEFKMLSTLPLSGLLETVFAYHTLYDIDTWKMTPTLPISGILALVVIMHTLYDADSFKMTPTLPLAAGSSLV